MKFFKDKQWWRERATLVKHWFGAHKEVWLLAFLPVIVLSYMFINRYVTPIWTVITPLDDKIPFSEYWIIPYCIWYVVYPGSLLFFLFKDKKAYFNLCWMMIGGLLIATVFYLAVPNHVPFEEVGPDNDGFFAQWANLIRGGATRNAAFPSEHCVVAIAIDFAVQRSDFFKKRYVWRAVSFLFMLSVCAATVFLKQHSVLDMFGSFIVVMVLNMISIYYGWYKEDRAARKAGSAMPTIAETVPVEAEAAAAIETVVEE